MSIYRYTLLLIVASIYSTGLFAKKTQILTLDTAYQVGEKNQCRALRVIDLRENKETIGSLNHNTHLVTDKPLAELLSGHFDKIIKGSARGNDELVLVLYHMDIEDQVHNIELGTFYFDGDFYRNNNGQYMFVGKVDSFYEVISNIDVSKALIKMVQSRVNVILGNYARLDTRTMDAPVYTEAQLADRRRQNNLNYAIYQAGNFKKGIYYSVDQFINNTPVDTPFIKDRYQINAERKATLLFYQNEKGQKGKRVGEDAYFAVYDGKDWVISNGDECVPLEYKDGEFYANVPLNGIKRSDASVVSPVFAEPMGGGVFVGVRLNSKKSKELSAKGSGMYKARFDPAIKDFKPMKRLL